MTNLDAIPLCVDLDGTLIHSDLLLETWLLLFRRNPLYLFLVPLWLFRGKAVLKAEIAKRVILNPAALPYNQTFLSWLREQKKNGRPLWLCTASNYRLAEKVAGHLAIFDGVLSSSDSENLSGHTKSMLLVNRFGKRLFDYCGNHAIDLAIWKVSQGGAVVNGSARLEAQAKRLTDVGITFPREGPSLRAVLKALRLHQWAKNVLVFVPIAAAHKLSDVSSLLAAAASFVAFGLCASSVYLANDLLDLEADRQHPSKKYRPFAAGELSLLAGFAGAPLLALVSFVLALVLSAEFFAVLVVYYALATVYSFRLKRLVLLDILALTLLYTIRIVAGSMAAHVPLSFWLLLFSVFLFLSLALVKRYAELKVMERQGKLTTEGRGYHIEDLPILHSMGVAAGYVCVLVLALYINSPAVEALYTHPEAIWFICVLLLYWISRVWVKAHRGTMHDDPVVFALKDRVSLGIMCMAAVAIAVAVS